MLLFLMLTDFLSPLLPGFSGSYGRGFNLHSSVPAWGEHKRKYEAVEVVKVAVFGGKVKCSVTLK